MEATSYEGGVESASLLLPGSEDIGPAEVVRRARALIPVLRQRAQATEEARRLLPQTLEDFKRAGLFRICQPRRFGGFEMGIDVLQEVLMELGRGCGSSAWTLGILSGHSWFAAGFCEEGQRELFGEDGHAIISTTLSGRGVARRVDGGYRISGRYAVQSGCDVANWHCVGAYLEGGDGTSASGLYCAVRPHQASIDDNWFVLGMRGTGSKSVVVEDAFVPEHLTLPMHLVETQQTPGSRLYANPFYGAPWRAFLFIEITGAIVGVALQAVDVLDEIARAKPLRGREGALQMESPAMRRRLAEAKTLAEAARVLLLAESRRFMAMAAEYAGQGRRFSREEISEYALNVARVVDFSVQAVDHAFAAAGTSAAYTGHPMERCLRDIKMMSTHAAYRFDTAAENWGLAHFGL